MTHKENITAILECHFTGFKEEIIESACNRILEQEQCEDAISRQAVLDIVDSYSESQSNVEDVTQDIISDIVVLPSVNPTKTGHWIPIQETIGVDKEGNELDICVRSAEKDTK